MEYDPAVQTHKASSITSTTSTNSSTSTWDHPMMTGSSSTAFLHHSAKPIEEEEDYNQFVADRISLSTAPASFVDYHAAAVAEEEKYNNQQRQIGKGTFSNYIDTFISNNNEEEVERDNLNTALPELISPTNIKKENYHEKMISSSQKQQQHDHQLQKKKNVTQQQENFPVPIYLQHGDQITVPSSAATSFLTFNNNNRKRGLSTSNSQEDQAQTSSYSSSSVSARPILPSPNTTTTTAAHHHLSAEYHQRERSNSVSSISSAGNKRSKLNRDILTDDEKRVNHIASEQKRRNTIRLGFKDLTDIIPTLKNVNNSKSTILFKAVEYIKHLDKRNRNLREKVSSLQVRMTVEGRLIEQQQKYRNNSLKYNKVFGKQQQQQQVQPLLPQPQQQSVTAAAPTAADDHSSSHEFSHLPAQTVSALIAHKNQQRQLEQLQEQLRAQQQLLQKHNILPPDHHTYKRSSLPILHSNEYKSSSAFQATNLSSSTTTTTISEPPKEYNSISIPSSRSSNSDENEITTTTTFHHHPSLIVPQDLEDQQHQHHPTLLQHASTTKRRPWHSIDATANNDNIL